MGQRCGLQLFIEVDLNFVIRGQSQQLYYIVLCTVLSFSCCLLVVTLPACLLTCSYKKKTLWYNIYYCSAASDSIISMILALNCIC